MPKRQKNNFIGIQGFGYVGAVNAVNVALGKNLANYRIICFEKKNKKTLKIFEKAAKGIFPYQTTDRKLLVNFKNLVKKKRIIFSFNEKNYKTTKTILITINYDLINFKKSRNSFLDSFKNILKNISNNTLIIVETTVPPGTCEKDLKPLIENTQKRRNIKKIYLAHSFERVTPGDNYLNSCKETFKVYSGINEKSKKLCKNFLSKITNTQKYPLTLLENTTASETCKIIENSYRSVNIAFINEWMIFCKKFKLNLFNIINAIKKRKTHNNIMMPGLGVGGYCLTKDPEFGRLSELTFLREKKNNFPLSSLSIKINKTMINNSIDLIQRKFKKNLKGKKILIIGMSYKNDVGDLRNSPSVSLSKKLQKKGCHISYYDPLVNQNEIPFERIESFNKNLNFDIILFCVKHKIFKNYSFINYKRFKKSYFFDLNNIFEDNLIIKKTKNYNFFKLSYSC